MTQRDHVRLIEKGITGSVWADFGSGDGAFTLALAQLLGSSAIIYSIEQDSKKLQEQEKQFAQLFPKTDVRFLQADFTAPLNLPKLDGIIVANSLHFHKKKLPLFTLFGRYLKKDGHFIVVEYNIDVGNVFVPHPFSFSTFSQLAGVTGFHNPRLLTTVPSGFLQEMYSAIAVK